MKKYLSLLTALVCLTGYSQFSTNSASFTGGLQQIADAISNTTNWTAVAGGGRSLTGNKNLAFAAVAYGFNENVGVVLGYDTLWSKRITQQNSVKGGLTLQATIHPFTFIGTTFLTNVVATPFAGYLIASPKNSKDALAQIATVGVNFNLLEFSRFVLDAGGQYENRTGQGIWSGNYILAHLGITRAF